MMGKSHLNTVAVSGEVKALTRYDDRGQEKLVLTICNAEGSYCIEFAPASDAPVIEKGDQIMVHGNLFSSQREGKNTTKINAKSLLPVKG